MRPLLLSLRWPRTRLKLTPLPPPLVLVKQRQLRAAQLPCRPRLQSSALRGTQPRVQAGPAEGMVDLLPPTLGQRPSLRLMLQRRMPSTEGRWPLLGGLQAVLQAEAGVVVRWQRSEPQRRLQGSGSSILRPLRPPVRQRLSGKHKHKGKGLACPRTHHKARA